MKSGKKDSPPPPKKKKTINLLYTENNLCRQNPCFSRNQNFLKESDKSLHKAHPF